MRVHQHHAQGFEGHGRRGELQRQPGQGQRRRIVQKQQQTHVGQQQRRQGQAADHQHRQPRHVPAPGPCRGNVAGAERLSDQRRRGQPEAVGQQQPQQQQIGQHVPRGQLRGADVPQNPEERQHARGKEDVLHSGRHRQAQQGP